MTHKLLSMLAVMLFAFQSAFAANGPYTIYPVPQKQTALTGTAVFTPQVTIVAESGIDQYTIDRAKSVLSQYGITAEVSSAASENKANIYIGINGSNGAADQKASAVGVSRDVFSIDGKYDRHVLHLANGSNGKAELVVLGQHTDAAFYAFASLEQMLDAATKQGDNISLAAVEIDDYADIASRGVIEGYYGIPYSAEVTKDLFRFMMRFKMNTYMYGAKSDPYHSQYWESPYPTTITDEQKKIGYLTQGMMKDIVATAHECKVNFIWAIHPGNSFVDDANVNEKIMKKFESMYAIGLRQFGVFVDDVAMPSNESTMKLCGSRLTDLQEKIDKRFNAAGTAAADTVKPLHYVPQLYAFSWENADYRKKFFSALSSTPSKIAIYITGAAVWSVPNSADLSAVKNEYGLGRSPMWWWNYPCNDNDMDKLFPMDTYSNFHDETQINNNAKLPADLSGTEGIISNPMQQGEISKIALFSVGDYTWNHAAFNNLDSWHASLPAIVGKDKAEDFKFLANYLRFYDSSALSTLVARYKSGSAKASEVTAEMDRIINAANSLDEMKNSDNESYRLFHEDMKPWLLKVREMASIAKGLLEVSEISDKAEAWEKFSEFLPRIAALDTADEFHCDILTGLGSAISKGKRLVRPANETLRPFIDYLKDKAFKLSNTSPSEAYIFSNHNNVSGALSKTGENELYFNVRTRNRLAPKEYIGMAFPAPQYLAGITVADSLLNSGIFTVYVSEDAKVWNKLNSQDLGDAPIAAISIQNTSSSDAMLKMGVNVLKVKQLKPAGFMSAKTSYTGYYSNWDASKFIDGDLNTLCSFNRNQANGDTYTAVLSENTDVRQVRVYFGTENGDYMNAGRVEVSSDEKTWMPLNVRGTSTPDLSLTMPQAVKYSDIITYADFEPASGMPAEGVKYVRLRVTNANGSKWLRLYDIEVNTNVTDGIAKIGQGQPADAVCDGKISTVLSQDAASPLVYRFVRPTIPSSATIYAGSDVASANASVYVTTDGQKWEKLTNLTSPFTVVDLQEYPTARALKIEWNGTAAPAIYEIEETTSEKSPVISSIVSVSGKSGHDISLTVNDGSISVNSEKSPIEKIEVFNLGGQKVFSENYGNAYSTVLPANSNEGVCVVSVTTSDNSTATFKATCR